MNKSETQTGEVEQCDYGGCELPAVHGISFGGKDAGFCPGHWNEVPVL